MKATFPPSASKLMNDVLIKFPDTLFVITYNHWLPGWTIFKEFAFKKKISSIIWIFSFQFKHIACSLNKRNLTTDITSATMSTVAITKKQCPNCSTWKSFNIFFTELFLPLPVFPYLNEKIDLEIRFIRLFGNLFEMAFNTLLIVSLSETRREHVFALDKRIVTLSLLLVALSPNVSSWRMLITFQDRISVILKSRKICDSSSPGTIDGTVIPSVSGIRGQSGSSNGKKKERNSFSGSF